MVGSEFSHYFLAIACSYYNSIGGETQTYSLLFAHAQDTLMTVYSEIHMTKQLLQIFEGYEQRIRALEEKIAK